MTEKFVPRSILKIAREKAASLSFGDKGYQYPCNQGEPKKFFTELYRHTIFVHCEILEGTKAKLQSYGIGVGLAFPGEPGAPVRQFTKPLGGGHRLILRKLSGHAAGRYEAKIQYCDEYEKQLLDDEDQRKKREFAEKAIAELPASVDEYRQFGQDVFRLTAAALRRVIHSGSGGYQYQYDIADLLDEGLKKVERLLDSGWVTYSPEERGYHIEEIYERYGAVPLEEKPGQRLRLVKR